MKWNLRSLKFAGSSVAAGLAGRLRWPASLFSSFQVVLGLTGQDVNASVRGWEDAVWSKSKSWWAASSDTSGLQTCSFLHESLHREHLLGFDDPAGVALSCRSERFYETKMWSRNRKPPPVCWAVCWRTEHVVLMDAEEPGCSLPSSVLHC